MLCSSWQLGDSKRSLPLFVIELKKKHVSQSAGFSLFVLLKCGHAPHINMWHQSYYRSRIRFIFYIVNISATDIYLSFKSSQQFVKCPTLKSLMWEMKVWSVCYFVFTTLNCLLRPFFLFKLNIWITYHFIWSYMTK